MSSEFTKPSSVVHLNAESVLRFWLEETPLEMLFAKHPAFDLQIRLRFGDLHTAATRGELADWRTTPRGILAEIIILDQFSRNIHRDEPQAFQHDAQALTLAQMAVQLKMDEGLSAKEKAFLYMPYMHSESLRVHEDAVRLFSQPGLETNLDFEMRHKAIIEQFGRYPHRNRILGRESTSAEIDFLKHPGSSF